MEIMLQLLERASEEAGKEKEKVLCQMSGAMFGPLNILFTSVFQESCEMKFYPHFIDQEAEAQGN
jgi:hypothetical protein